MGDLTRNFSAREFRCRGGKCCDGAAKVDTLLVNSLQQLRDLSGSGITVTSGYRCPEHNAKIGGAKNSQHAKGTAADIIIKDCITPGLVILTDREIHNYQKYGTLAKGLDEFQMVATIEEMYNAAAKMMALAMKVDAFREGGIGLYYGRIHVDVREGGAARWDERK